MTTEHKTILIIGGAVGLGVLIYAMRPKPVLIPAAPPPNPIANLIASIFRSTTSNVSPSGVQMQSTQTSPADWNLPDFTS